MDTYYTVEEKYLKALEKVNYGKSPKALKLLRDIVSNDPLYARAHYQLGKLYYYDINDYQTAGYHFKTCAELEPAFPDVYFDYLRLVVFLNMEKQVHVIAAKALTVPGVDTAEIHDLLGLFYEKKKDWKNSLAAYHTAFLEVTDKNDKKNIEESLARVNAKIKLGTAYQYHLAE